jgi:hypothetical protein
MGVKDQVRPERIVCHVANASVCRHSSVADYQELAAAALIRQALAERAPRR